MDKTIENTIGLILTDLPDDYIIRNVDEIYFRIITGSHTCTNSGTDVFDVYLPFPRITDEDMSEEKKNSRKPITARLLIRDTNPHHKTITEFFRKIPELPDISFHTKGQIDSDTFIVSLIEIYGAKPSSNELGVLGTGQIKQDLDSILNIAITDTFPRDLKTSIKTKSGIKFFYELYKDRYPRSLYEWFESTVSNGKQDKLYRFLNVDWRKKELNLPSKEEAYKILDETLYGMTNVKEAIISILEMVRRSGKLSFNILLCGPAGVGKTTIAQAIARVFNLPMSDIPMAMCQDAETFSGFGTTYNDSQEGLFTSRVFEPRYYDKNGYVSTAHQITQVIFLNELDSVYKDGNTHGSVQSTLFRALDDNREFMDVYYGTSYPLENAMIIADINDKSLLKKPLLDRFLVIDVDGYSTEEKETIFKDYVFPKTLNKNNVSAEELSVSDDAAKFICETSVTSGVRELKSTAEEIIGNYLVKYNDPDSHTEYSKEMVSKLVLRDYEKIFDMIASGKDPYTISTTETIATAAKIYFKIHKNRYPGVMQDWLDHAVSSDNIAGALRFLSVDWRKQELTLPSKEEARRLLDETVYGMEEVKDKIIYILEIVRRSGKLSYNILLNGPAGVGKTTVAQALSRIFNLPMSRISMAKCLDARFFVGVKKVKEGSFTSEVLQPKYYGEFDNVISSTNQISQVLFLNELDKIPWNGDVQSILLRMLDDNRQFYDEYHEVSYPLENVMIIADSNDKTNLQKPLLDRFMVIDVDGYTSEEKEHIFKDYVFPRYLSVINATSKELSVSDEAVSLICRQSKEPGVRELHHIAETIIGNYLVKHSSNGIKTEYTADMVRELICCKNDNFYFRAC